MSFSNRIPKTAWAILVLLLLCACILRFTQLQDAPAGVQGDVSWGGINALHWGDRGGRVWRWALAVFVLGLTQYIYLPAGLPPVVLALWLGFVLLTQRHRFLEQFRGFVLAAAVALLVALPAILLFITTPATFSARAD